MGLHAQEELGTEQQKLLPNPNKAEASWERNISGGESAVLTKFPRDEALWFTCDRGLEAAAPSAITASISSASSTTTATAAGSLPQAKLCSKEDSKPLTRAQLFAHFENSWALTEMLFAGLKGETPFYIAPRHGLRHPLIFYYGHVACFYINKMRVAGLLEAGIDSWVENMCEVGVDEMGWDDMAKNDADWPSVAHLHEYRKKVFQLVKSVILSTSDSGKKLECPKSGRITSGSPGWSIVMAIEHEHIHLETSSVLFRELPIELVGVPAGWPAYHPSVAGGWGNSTFEPNKFLPVQGRVIEIILVEIIGINIRWANFDINSDN